jgi:hypothetical protein
MKEHEQEGEIYDHTKRGFFRKMFILRLGYKNGISLWLIGGGITGLIISQHYAEIMEAFHYIGLYEVERYIRDFSHKSTRMDINKIWLLWGFSTLLYALAYEVVIVAPLNLVRRTVAKLKGKKYFYNYFGHITKV